MPRPCPLLELRQRTLEILRRVGIGVDVQPVQREVESQEGGSFSQERKTP